MSETTYAVERDIMEAQAMTDALDEYVRGDQLYGKAGGGFFSGGNIPALTLGALLMRLRRLNAMPLDDPQREQLGRIQTEHDRVKREWSLHYNEKLHQEAKSRLKAMDHFFEEMRDDPRAGVQGYLPEALRRTIVQEIADALSAPGAALAQTLPSDLNIALRTADGGLRRYTEPAEFIWAKALQPCYPQDKYWWLYVKPASPGKRADEE